MVYEQESVAAVENKLAKASLNDENENQTSEQSENSVQNPSSTEEDANNNAQQGAEAGEEENNPDFQTKHPLEHEWCMWYDMRIVGSTKAPTKKFTNMYQANLQFIGEVGFVEDFWSYFNHILKPSQIKVNSNYHFFKKGIKPMWEDGANRNGGKWVIQLKTIKDDDEVDQIWERILLGMIGEYLADDSDEICGVVFSRRKAGNRIAVWNKTKDNEPAIMQLGHSIKSVIESSKNVRLEYQFHEDALQTGLSYKNDIKYVL